MSIPQSRSAGILDKRTYPAGREIFKEGDDGDGAYLVESGSVGIYRRDGDLSTRLGVVGPGEIFGEMALVDGAPRMASAITETAATVICIHKSVVEQKVAAADPFVRGMLNLFLKHIRDKYRTYIRKPRSITDSLLMIDAYAAGIADYMEKTDPTEQTAEMSGRVQELRGLAGQMLELAGQIKDKRASVIGPADLEGARLRDLVKTE